MPDSENRDPHLAVSEKSEDANFQGLRVAAFESRRSEDMERMIRRFGGEPFVSPSMREIPIGNNQAAIEFAQSIIAGQLDVLILMTGVGLRYLVEEVEAAVGREEFLAAIGKLETVARGPKPVAVMRELGLAPTHRVPEPNTWRELLETMDASVPISGRKVGLQEYGLSNARLIAGLRERGADVQALQVYRWDFPEDTGPLESNVQAIAAGERDMALFTSAHQVVNALSMAERLGQLDAFRNALTGMLIVSIGPTTSEMLKDHELPVDLEPEHPKMGHLVTAAASSKARSMLADKRRGA